MAYVGAAEAPPGCVFCAALAGPDDRRSLVLTRRPHAYLVLNAYPYTPGHLLAVVNRHVATLPEATRDEIVQTMELVVLAMDLLAHEYRAEGFNVGLNHGRVAGAGIADHLHLHVVPRWNGDANFVSVVGEVRVLPEALEATWERLRGRLAPPLTHG
jgi:ATP adenylyltransferase